MIEQSYKGRGLLHSVQGPNYPTGRPEFYYTEFMCENGGNLKLPFKFPFAPSEFTKTKWDIKVNITSVDELSEAQAEIKVLKKKVEWLERQAFGKCV
jgi:hypothetical protein